MVYRGFVFHLTALEEIEEGFSVVCAGKRNLDRLTETGLLLHLAGLEVVKVRIMVPRQRYWMIILSQKLMNLLKDACFPKSAKLATILSLNSLSAETMYGLV